MSAEPKIKIDEEERLWTVREVASYLSCSASWVYQAVAAGRIPVVRIGALVRFEPTAIRAWVHGERGGKVVALPGRNTR